MERDMAIRDANNNNALSRNQNCRPELFDAFESDDDEDEMGYMDQKFRSWRENMRRNRVSFLAYEHERLEISHQLQDIVVDMKKLREDIGEDILNEPDGGEAKLAAKSLPAIDLKAGGDCAMPIVYGVSKQLAPKEKLEKQQQQELYKNQKEKAGKRALRCIIA